MYILSFKKTLLRHGLVLGNRSDSFTHELGRLFGGNHFDSQNLISQTWVDDVIDNGFTEVFDELVYDIFASIMITSTGHPRCLYFSNQNVIVNEVPTGNLTTKNNAKIIDDLSPVMSTYRGRLDMIFINDFK